MDDATPLPPTGLESTLEELRASVAAEDAYQGLRAAIQKALLRLLTALVTLLADLRADTPATVAPVAEEAGAMEAPLSPHPDASLQEERELCATRRAGGASQCVAAVDCAPLTLPLRGPLPLPQGERELRGTLACWFDLSPCQEERGRVGAVWRDSINGVAGAGDFCVHFVTISQ